MKVIDDGIIKYDRSNFTYLPKLPIDEFSKIEYWREKLYKLNLIGEEPISKIGFGNLSAKYDFHDIFISNHPQFVITGTQTGKYAKLNDNHYTRILDYDIQVLKIFVMGPIMASSEALTHAAIYSSNPRIGSVVHVHSHDIWDGIIKNNFPCVSSEIPYGTLEMANATQAITKNINQGFFAMKGHTDGVISFGTNIEEASLIMLSLFEKFSHKN